MSAIDLNARASATFAQKLAETQALLKKAVTDFAPTSLGAEPHITLACSLGAEDMVLAHLINQLQLNVGIFVLDTGQLHAETLALLDRLKATSKAHVGVFAPVTESVVQFVSREGKDAMYQSIALRKACCQIRKMEPLGRALAGKAVWITGLRREQSDARAEVPLIDTSDAARVKLNPLVNWTWGDVWFYIAQNKVDYNPLHDQFYPSIGCAPCTRAISLGEDFRAGRWWWESEAAKECGLHVKANDNEKASA
jgi:phosphoadenosine phosphosulfate reductase